MPGDSPARAVASAFKSCYVSKAALKTGLWTCSCSLWVTWPSYVGTCGTPSAGIQDAESIRVSSSPTEKLPVEF